LKRILIALTVLAFTAGLVGVASADEGWSVKAFGKQKFISLATSDSTTITIEWDAASNATAKAETTATLDLRQYTYGWTNNGTTVGPILCATVSYSGADNSAASATTDTVTVIGMYSYDGVTWQDGVTTTLGGVSPIDGDFVTTLATAGNGLGAGLWRFRISHFTQGATASRQAWIKPYLYIAKSP